MVYFGSCGLLCYDLTGKEQWKVEMPPAVISGNFGSGTSPIVADGLVVLVRAGRMVYPDPPARSQRFLPWGPGQPAQPGQLGQPPPPDVPYYAYLDGQLQGVDPGDYWDDPVPNGRASSPN